ncbi:MAG: phage holin family protein [Halanaerobiales bacterium]
MNWTGSIVRFIVSAIVLLAVGYFLPGFSMIGFGNALIAALVIAVLGYIMETIFGEKISPQNKGIVGFLSAAVVIYLTQFVVTGLDVSILGAVLAAVLIGMVDVFVPTELR